MSLSSARQNIAHLIQHLMTRLQGAPGQEAPSSSSPEEYEGPAPTDLLSSPDGDTRLMILVCLNVVYEADFTFVSTISRKASEEERLRSLAWLKEQGCVRERHHWERRGFLWRHRVELVFYSLTPTGRMLHEKIAALYGADDSSRASSSTFARSVDYLLYSIALICGIGLVIVMVLLNLH